MLSSLQALRSELENLEKNPDDYRLTAEEVQKLDTLYRNVRNASRDYMADHQSPSSVMGQTRRNGAELMSNMHPLALGAAKKPVTKKTIEEMNKQFEKKRKDGLTKPVKKERRTKKTVQYAKDIAQKAQNNQGPASSI
jgi:hypothetical protein